MNIIEFLDKEGRIDDEAVAYKDKSYPFTLEEFRKFTDKIWNDAGGWDASDKYAFKEAYFETYHVPFKHEDKDYVLNVMFGQGSAWTLFTKAEHDAYKQEIAEFGKQWRKEDEDSNLPNQHDSE